MANPDLRRRGRSPEPLGHIQGLSDLLIIQLAVRSEALRCQWTRAPRVAWILRQDEGSGAALARLTVMRFRG